MTDEVKSRAEAQKEYNRDYYNRKRKEISDRRRLEYATNPKRRATLQRAALKTYRKKAQKDKSRVNYSVKIVDGKHLYSIQYASAVIGKSPDFIRLWEKEGKLPLSSYTDTRDWRLYTDHQLNVMSEGFRLYAKRELNKSSLVAFLFANWEE